MPPTSSKRCFLPRQPTWGGSAARGRKTASAPGCGRSRAARACDCFRKRRGGLDAEGGSSAYRRLVNLPESCEERSSSDCLEHDGRFSRRVLDLVRAEFEDRSWDAFYRTVVDGQSPAEVAEALSMSLHAVYKAKSRVLRRLRDELQDLLE